jgi:hypothetical protein
MSVNACLRKLRLGIAYGVVLCRFGSSVKPHPANNLVMTSEQLIFRKLIFSSLEVALIVWATTGYLKWSRAHSSAARERASYKQRLPGWIKNLELLLLAVLLGPSLSALVLLSFSLHGLFQTDTTGTVAKVLICIPDFFFAIMFTMFAINFIEWIIPPLRRVNEKAMEGLPAASFHQSNKDFLHVLAWAGPACLMLWLLGLVLR